MATQLATMTKQEKLISLILLGWYLSIYVIMLIAQNIEAAY